MAPFLPSIIRAALIVWVVLHAVAGMSGSAFQIEVDPTALRNIVWITGVAGLVALVEIRRQRPQVFLGNIGIHWIRLWGVSFAAVCGAEIALQVAIALLGRV